MSPGQVFPCRNSIDVDLLDPASQNALTAARRLSAAIDAEGKCETPSYIFQRGSMIAWRQRTGRGVKCRIKLPP